jgi:hypothetical protein
MVGRTDVEDHFPPFENREGWGSLASSVIATGRGISLPKSRCGGDPSLRKERFAPDDNPSLAHYVNFQRVALLTKSFSVQARMTRGRME